MSGRAEVPVTERHRSLQDFEGEWNLTQKFFTGAKGDPIVNHGKTVSRIMLGGRAMFMESELENGYSSILLYTWNVAKGTYEGVFMDIHSFDGLDPLDGAPSARLPVTGDCNPKMGDGEMFAGMVRERVWKSRLTIPRNASMVAGAPETIAGVDQVPVEVYEHKVSDKEWLLACVAMDAAGDPYVQMENTYTR